MTPSIPQHLIDEQRQLEVEIREAFKGVTREGGVSWSEAEVIDSYGSEEERLAARAKDTDQSWTDLATDPDWNIGPCVGGWNFLDSIGFRYYLPAAMIRTLHSGHEAGYTTSLDITLDVGTYRLHDLVLLNRRQLACVARFVRFMAARDRTDNLVVEADAWQNAYNGYWYSCE